MREKNLFYSYISTQKNRLGSFVEDACMISPKVLQKSLLEKTFQVSFYAASQFTVHNYQTESRYLL